MNARTRLASRALVALLAVSTLLLAATAPAQTLTLWNLQNADPSPWTDPKGLTSSVKEGRLCLDIEEPDSWTTLTGLTWTPSPTDAFLLRYRAEGFNVESTTGEIFYVNEAHGIAHQHYVVLPSLIPDGDWHELIVPVRNHLRSGIDGWANGGTISSFRFDFVNQAPGHIEIESLLLSADLREITADDVDAGPGRGYLFQTKTFRPAPNGLFVHNAILPEGQYTVWARLIDTELGRKQLAGLNLSGTPITPPPSAETGRHTWIKVGHAAGGSLQLATVEPPSVFLDAVLVCEGEDAPRDRPLVVREPPISTIKPLELEPGRILAPYWTGRMLAVPGRRSVPDASSFFRQTVDVPADLESAWAQVSVDDCFRLYVNGELVIESVDRSTWDSPTALDIAESLIPGNPNCVAVEAINMSGTSGFLFDLTLNRADHSHTKMVSDTSWRCSATQAEGWTHTDFDDSAWQEPEAAAPPPAPPWRVRLPYQDKTYQFPTECIACDFKKVVRAGEPQEVTLRLRSDKPIEPGEALALRVINQADKRVLSSIDIRLEEDHCSRNDDGTVTVSGLDIPLSRWFPAMSLQLAFRIYGRELQSLPGQDLAFTLQNAPPQTPLESRVDATGNTPRLVVNGQPIYPLIGNGSGRDNSFIREIYHRAGFNVESMWIDGMGSEPWWVGPGEYAFSAVDKKIVEALDFNPDILFLPIIWAAPPTWWADLNPDEIARFSDGKTWAYYRATHSFSSEVWKEDAAAAITAFVEHVESMPYASRILGYWIVGGVSSEWQGWGCHSCHARNHLMDYSRPAQEGFRAFLQRTYPERADGFASAEIPAYETRIASENGMLRDPAAAQLVVDFDTYYSESVVDGMLHCLRAAKDACGRCKIVGTYFGYSMEYPNICWAHHMSGHNALRKALDSPDVDFFTAPPSYSVRKLGEDQSWMWPFRAIHKAGKLVWVDDDTRTYQSGVCGYSPLVNPAETREGLRRNFAKVLCRLCPLGYYQIASGRELDDPDVAQDIRAIRRAGEYALAHNVERHAEIAVVIDEDSVKYLKYDGERLPSGEVDRIVSWNGDVANVPRKGNTLTGDLISFQRDRIARIGAPVDYLLFSDLPKYDLDYKLYIMLSCVQYSDAELQAVRERLQAEPTTILWCYAPGFVHDGTANVENMEALTGIQFAMLDEPASPRTNIVDFSHPILAAPLHNTTFGVEYAFAPLFYVGDDAATLLGVYADTGKASLTVKQVGASTAVFCGSNKLSADLLHSIARAAGVHVYSDTLEPCDANDRFVSLHSSRTGPKTIALKQPQDVVDVYDGAVLFRNVDRFTIEMPFETTRLFYVGEAQEFLRFMNTPPS